MIIAQAKPTGGFKTRRPVWDGARSPGARGRVIGASLKGGVGYLADGSADACGSLLRAIAARPGDTLWITTRTDRLPVDGGAILRVTSLVHSPGTVDPKRLQDLKVAAHAFLDAHPEGIMVLDGLDALSLHNGVERVVRMVEELHDEVSTRSAYLFVFVDRNRANSRLLAMLARELDPFSEDDAFSPDLLVA